jgi:RND family efflux transporter MFP subunit
VVAQLRAQLQTQEAGLQEQEASFQLADKDRKRMAKLFEKGLLAEQSLDKAQADREGAQGRLQSTRKLFEAAKVKLSEDASVQEETVKHALTNLEQELAVQTLVLEQARAGLELAQREAEASAASFDAEISVLEATLPRLEAELDQAKTRLGYATVLAPIDGVVGTITTQEGETVAAGFSAPTFVTVVDLARLQVDAYVDEVDIGKVKPGQEASFAVDAFPDREFKGKVAAIYPSAVLKDNVVYYDVVVDIVDQFAGLLRPEMTANVSIYSLKKPAAPGLPLRALIRKEGKAFVQVLEGPKVVLRQVTVGIEEEDFVELSAGVKPGDKVLLPELKSGAGFPHGPGGGPMGGGLMGGHR